jgi:chromosome segregation ATPase
MDKFEQFLEVVAIIKDSKKAEKVLGDIQERERQLVAVIETVGKVGEIEKIRKETLLAKDSAAKELEEAKAKVAKSTAAAAERIAKQDLVIQEREAKLATLEALANSKLQAAKDLQESFSGRDKKLRSEEEQIKQIREQLSKDSVEVTERLEKLRLAMGA